MKIAIIGYGVEGQAAYTYWNTPSNQLTICDQNESLVVPNGASAQLGATHLQGLEKFDVIVRSPIIRPDDIVAANSPAILEKVTTNVNEFFQACPTRHIIGVTGTKGKGTTSTLIATMLTAAGKVVHLGGNIGVAPLELLREHIGVEDWVVLELSSFQLIDCQFSPAIGVCLMVVPEHLNWHKDMQEYLAAKSQLFAHQKTDDIAIYFAGNDSSKKIAAAGHGHKLPFFTPPGAYVENDELVIDGHSICKTSELKLLGRHNWQNACAAITAVWQITKDIRAMRTVLSSFTGLEHRLEFVRELNGIRYYDDSFGTTPETASVAIEAFSQPKVLILGGSDKGATYGQLAQIVASQNVRSVVLIGETGPAIQADLNRAGFRNIIPGGTTMTEIVKTAREAAQPGDVVLLSTACASFDLFKDYKDRGNQFKQAVAALAGAA